MSVQQHKQTVFGIYSKETGRYPWLFTATCLGLLAMSGSQLIAPLYMKQFFNTLAGGPTASNVHLLIYFLIMIGIFYILEWVGMRLLFFSLIYSESRVVQNLYTRSFEYLMRHSQQFFSSQFSGTLTRRVSKFANSYEDIYDSVMMQFVPTSMFVIGAVVILFIRNHALGIALAVWAILFVAFEFAVAKWQRPLREATAEEDSRLTGALADAISNQNTITLFSGNAFEEHRFLEAAKKWRNMTLKSWSSNEYIWATLGLFIVVIEIGLMAGGVYFWLHGLLTLGDFVLIQAYLITTIQQLIGINRTLRRFFDRYADANEMVKILNTPHEVQDAPGAKALEVTEGKIALIDAGFYFHKDNPVIEGFSLEIAGGEKVALVGPSGAGKSTITRLLLRFYDVRSGAITIDGQDIRDVTQDSLRDAIAFVPQEPILFHRSLMENIRYGRRDATDAEVLEAARQAHCHEFIMNFPDKYETFVGERGVKLSGGERQRVAIARAILKNSPILILDEATSSLDSESEHLIQDALRTLMKGKTVIVIAHRLSTIMTMDRIIVIEGGKIVAQGPHDALLNDTSSLYHKLWSIQAGGFLVDEDGELPEPGNEDSEEEFEEEGG